MSARLRAILFAQPSPLERLAWVRASLGLVILTWIVLGIHDRFYFDAAATMYAPYGIVQLPVLGRAGFLALEALAAMGAVMTTLGLGGRFGTGLLAVAFLLLNGYISRFTPPFLWAATTHLNFFAFALCVGRPTARFSLDARLRRASIVTGRDHDLSSVALGFMQVYVALLYFQAGATKLGNVGPHWFLSGEVPYVSVFMLDAPRGRWLAQWPWIFRLFTLGTGVFELSFLPMVLAGPRTRRLAAAAAIAFHLGIFIVMDISFWHLWVLFPALFLARPREVAMAPDAG